MTIDDSTRYYLGTHSTDDVPPVRCVSPTLCGVHMATGTHSHKPGWRQQISVSYMVERDPWVG